MKPYNQLHEAHSPEGVSFGLYERDNTFHYQVGSFPVASSKESNCEQELVKLVSRPFKPARQPKILIVGLGLGAAVNQFAEELLQKRATFDVLDLNPKALHWYKEHYCVSDFAHKRCELHREFVQPFVTQKPDYYHAILFDPELWRVSAPKGQAEDLTNKKFLNYFVTSLKMGGLLGFTTERPDKILKARLERCGLEVMTEYLPVVPNGKRTRTIWVAKKGHHFKS